MRWMIPKMKQDQDICADRKSSTNGGFNAPLAENDGGGSPSYYEADEDIRTGRIKQFDDIEDMIESLKKPWQD